MAVNDITIPEAIQGSQAVRMCVCVCVCVAYIYIALAI